MKYLYARAAPTDVDALTITVKEACKEQCVKDGIDYTDALAGLYD